MTRSEFIDALVQKQTQLNPRDVELAIKAILEYVTQAMAQGKRVEVRGFGSFSLHYRASRMGRNPRSGAAVSLPAKCVPYFKPGKMLRERIDRTKPAVSPAGATASPANAPTAPVT